MKIKLAFLLCSLFTITSVYADKDVKIQFQNNSAKNFVFMASSAAKAQPGLVQSHNTTPVTVTIKEPLSKPQIIAILDQNQKLICNLYAGPLSRDGEFILTGSCSMSCTFNHGVLTDLNANIICN